MAYYRLDILQTVLYQCHSNLHVHEGCKNEPDTNIYDIMFAYAYYQLMHVICRYLPLTVYLQVVGS